MSVPRAYALNPWRNRKIQGEGEKMKKKLGIYIHIPFCKAKCRYCDFYSLPGCGDRLFDRYAEAVIRHIAEYSDSLSDYCADTVYFGGGTPTVMGADRIIKILSAVKKYAGVSRDAEITVEANPESSDFQTLKKLRRGGVNRISFGVQSADDAMLKKIGRLHTFAQACEAVKACRRAGISNINLDLMYGLPEQTAEQALDSLDRLIELNPQHISAYALKLSEGVPMYAEADRLPDDDSVADTYLMLTDRLERAGYAQYEISNFARDGKISRHNSKYWDLSEYLGIGAAAYSFFGGKRFNCVPDVEKYISATDGGDAVICDDYEIFQNEQCGEYIMLGLRTVNGISRAVYQKKFRKSFDKIGQAMQKYVQAGFAERNGDGFRLTPKGFLVSNAIITDVAGDLMKYKEKR